MITDRYKILNKSHFDDIAEQTGYSSSYVRKVIRGYVNLNARHQKILDLAEVHVQKYLDRIQIKKNG